MREETDAARKLRYEKNYHSGKRAEEELQIQEGSQRLAQ